MASSNGVVARVEMRLQTLAMFSYSMYFVGPMILLSWFNTSMMIIFPLTTLQIVCYLGWIYTVDKSASTGSRPPLLRYLTFWWAYACDYFPILLVKTADLDPDKKYVMGYHPHGIISVGAFGAFATDGAKTLSLLPQDNNATLGRGFKSLFPGIDRRLITLPMNFTTPFVREFILATGCCDSSKETFRNVLSTDGRAIVVVVGGAEESLIVNEGSIELVLERRKGFVREAILAGAYLVPVISYGETDVYKTHHAGDDHWITKVQYHFKNITGFAMPVFEGRSIFFKDFGLMPHRKPITIVVGAPIEPPAMDNEQRAHFYPKIDRSTMEPVNADGKILEEHHAKYVDALVALYKKHKLASWNQPGRNMRGSLVIRR